MFNFWKEYQDFRSNARDIDKELHSRKERHREESCFKKMLSERKRLNKLVSEKRKKDTSSRDRDKQDIVR